VNSEEGAYDAQVGWNVIARSADHDGWTDWYIYSGCDDGLPYLFASGADATAFVGRVKNAGCINAAAYWHCVESKHCDEVPDYAANWWRPEYN